jgi:arsenite methyltransferase
MEVLAMKRLQVFDPPMCCSTGVCGPSVNPALPQFAADLAWLQGQGVDVERYNLAQQPQAFAANELVRQQLTKYGNDCLPLLVADGQVVSAGVYLNRDQLAGLVGAPTAAELPLARKSCCCGTVPVLGVGQKSGSGCC